MLIVNVAYGDKDSDINIPTDWEDMTIEYYCGIFRIINKYTKLSDLKREASDSNFSKDLEEQALQNMDSIDAVKMNKELFQYMTNLSDEDIDKVPVEDAVEVLSAVNILRDEYTPKGIEYFDFEEERYFFPKDNMKKNTFGDYIEATQLDMNVEKLTNGRFDVLPEQMAILCKTMDEEVDLDNIDEKAKKFKNLTMDIVWEFSFFLNRRTVKSLGVIATFLEKVEQKVLQ